MHEAAMSFEPVIDDDAELARQMVVTQARFAQSRISRTKCLLRCGELRQAHHSFQQLRDIGVGNPEVTMAALAFGGDELGLLQAG